MNKKILKAVCSFLIIISLSAVAKWYPNLYFEYHPEVEVQIDYCVGKLNKYSFAGEPLPFNDAKMLSKYVFYHKKNLKKSSNLNILLINKNKITPLKSNQKLLKKKNVTAETQKFLPVSNIHI